MTGSAEPRRETATLLVSCPDRKGLVATLAQLLYGHGANILEADQYTDREAQQFFQRIHFDLGELRTDRVALEHGIREVADRLSMRYRLSHSDRVPRVAVFVSKYDHCLYDLVLRHRAGELVCDLCMIVSNHPDLGPLAAHFGIEFHCLPVSPETREAQESAALSLLAERRVDLVVLARYMQILTPRMVQAMPERIINIHHSFLPAFVGKQPYHRAHERGVKVIGATAHYVTDALDEGPIIHQDVAHTSHRDSVDELIRKGRDLERMVLSAAVRAHLEDRILVFGNRTVVFR
jgi:formyltetrahydrofolate deformylase